MQTLQTKMLALAIKGQAKKNISEVYSLWSAFLLINTQRKVNKFVVEPREILNALGRNTKNWNA